MANPIVQLIYKLVDQVTPGAKKIQKSLDDVEKSGEGAGKGVQAAGKKTKESNQSFLEAGVIVGGLAYALNNLRKSFSDVAQENESQRVSFETLTGSVERAKILMEEIKQLDIQSPFFDREELNRYAGQLYAIGIPQKELVKTIAELGDVAAGVGKDKLPQIVKAYGDVMTAGRLTSQEILQFTNANVPLLGHLPDKLGVSTQRVRKMAEEGQISSIMVAEAFREMTSEGGKFFNTVDRQAGTTTGKLANLQSAWLTLRIEIGQYLLPVLSKLYSIGSKILDWFNELGPTAKVFLATLLLLTPALLGVVAALAALTTAVGGVSIALAILAGSTGIGLIVAALAAAGYWVYKHTDTIALAFFQLKKSVLSIMKSIVDAVNKLPQALTNIFKGLNKAWKGFGLAFNVEFEGFDSKQLEKDIKEADAKIDEIRKKQAAKKKEQEAQEKAAKDAIDAEAVEAERKKQEVITEAQEKAAQEAQKEREKQARKEEQRRNKEEREAKERSDKVIEEFDRVNRRENELGLLTLDEKIRRNQILLEDERLTAEGRQEITDRITGYEIERENLVLQKKKQQGQLFIDAFGKLGEQQISLQEAISQGLIEFYKREALAAVDIEAAKWFQTGIGLLAKSFGLDPFGYAHIAASAALVAGSRAAISSIKLADGGIIPPQPGGVPAVIGEANRAEAVIPLDDPRAGEMLGGGNNSQRVIILDADGKTMLAKGIYKTQTNMLRTGELAERR